MLSIPFARVEFPESAPWDSLPRRSFMFLLVPGCSFLAAELSPVSKEHFFHLHLLFPTNFEAHVRDGQLSRVLPFGFSSLSFLWVSPPPPVIQLGMS